MALVSHLANIFGPMSLTAPMSPLRVELTHCMDVLIVRDRSTD